MKQHSAKQKLIIVREDPPDNAANFVQRLIRVYSKVASPLYNCVVERTHKSLPT